MPQSPFKVDQIQIEPGSGSGQTLLIKRASDGSLQFFDALNPQGVKLSAMSGLQGISNVILVGKTSTGVDHTSIQDALDSIVASTTSARNPVVIYIMPGVYTENLLIEKNGVYLVGLGGVVIESETESTPDTDPADTITIEATNPSDPPKNVALLNLTVTNSHQGKACVRVIGTSGSQIGLIDTSLVGGKPTNQFGLGGLWMESCRLISRGVGSFPVKAECLNSLFLLNSDCTYSDPTSQLQVLECAEFYARSIGGIQQLRLDYDTTSARPTPLETFCEYTLQDCKIESTAVFILRGLGSLTARGISVLGSTTVSGDRSSTFENSSLQALQVNDTSNVTLRSSSRGTLTGVGRLSEQTLSGALTFTAESTKSVVFAPRKLTAQYAVYIELPSAPVSSAFPCIESKVNTGFTVSFRDSAQALQNQTFTIRWTAIEF